MSVIKEVNGVKQEISNIYKNSQGIMNDIGCKYEEINGVNNKVFEKNGIQYIIKDGVLQDGYSISSISYGSYSTVGNQMKFVTNANMYWKNRQNLNITIQSIKKALNNITLNVEFDKTSNQIAYYRFYKAVNFGLTPFIFCTLSPYRVWSASSGSGTCNLYGSLSNYTLIPLYTVSTTTSNVKVDREIYSIPYTLNDTNKISVQIMRIESDISSANHYIYSGAWICIKNLFYLKQ